MVVTEMVKGQGPEKGMDMASSMEEDMEYR